MAGIVEGLGDQVGRVVRASAGHADVRRRSSGVLADGEMSLGHGVALGAVDGGGVGELDVPPGVGGVDHPISASVGEVEAALGFDEGNGPGVTVGDPELVVVASTPSATGGARRCATRA